MCGYELSLCVNPNFPRPRPTFPTVKPVGSGLRSAAPAAQSVAARSKYVYMFGAERTDEQVARAGSFMNQPTICGYSPFAHRLSVCGRIGRTWTEYGGGNDDKRENKQEGRATRFFNEAAANSVTDFSECPSAALFVLPVAKKPQLDLEKTKKRGERTVIVVHVCAIAAAVPRKEGNSSEKRVSDFGRNAGKVTCDSQSAQTLLSLSGEKWPARRSATADLSMRVRAFPLGRDCELSRRPLEVAFFFSSSRLCI